MEACPTGTLIFGDLDDPNSVAAKALAAGATEAMHPEYGLNEKVRYIGLPKRFVAGSVVWGDTDACAEAAEVVLEGDGVRRTTQTDNFGDFEFEDLAADTSYRVTVSAPGYEVEACEVKTTIDVYLGDIILQKTG